MAKRERQTLFTRPYVLALDQSQTYFIVTDRDGKVVAQGSYATVMTQKPLPSPFPSAPRQKKDDARISLTFEKKGGMVAMHAFAATYSAKHFLDAVIKTDKYKWLKRDRIGVKDLEISSPDIELILDHKFDAQEKSWELPTPYVEYAAHLRGDKKKPDMRESKAAQKAADREAKPTRTGTTNLDRAKRETDGMIGLADICADIKIEPRLARQYLRKEHDKPDHGWAWSKKDADKIKTELKRSLA